MIQIAKKAHWECPKCNAIISYEPEDIQINIETEIEYRTYGGSITHIIKTMYVDCPVCTERHNIRSEECDEKSHSRY